MLCQEGPDAGDSWPLSLADADATMAPVSLQSHSNDGQAKDFTRVLPFQLSVTILGKAALISHWFPLRARNGLQWGLANLSL